MEQQNSHGLLRRDFLSKVIPVCAMLCTGCGSALAGKASEKNIIEFQEKHRFDNDFPVKLTVRDYFKRIAAGKISTLHEIEKDIGEKRLLEILRRKAYNEGFAKGEHIAKEYPDKDFFSYNERFRSTDSFAKALITYDIVEDSERVFELKVTECVIVEPYIKAGAGKYADAELCNEDFSHAEGYNKKIKLIRDKTLTSGHTYCNHRYVLQD
ncbi:L-2-amino-thiazoline-4-carboxylic acid hydrolase [candidate division KSB1 bacterium]